MEILVQRGAGDLRGEDVVDPLMCALSVMLARGKALLDEHATLQQPVSLTIKFRTGVRLGQVIEAHDALQGVSYKAKITGISHKISGNKVVTVLDVTRPVVSF